jgi:hypothetical protein
MRSRRTLSFAVVTLLALLIAALPALAHEEIEVGPYLLEVGWLDEPPLVGIKNAVFLSIVNQETEEPVEDIGALQVEISAGGVSRALTMRPLGEETPGQFAGDFIPTRRGVYEVKLTGKIEETDVDVSQEIEEVEDAASIQFPEPLPDPLAANRAVEEAKAAASNAQTLAVVGIVVGAIGLALSVFGLLRRK